MKNLKDHFLNKLKNVRLDLSESIKKEIEEKTGLEVGIIDGENTTAIVPVNDLEARRLEFGSSDKSKVWRKLKQKIF